MIHELKTWPEYFESVLKGEKTFEYRVDDRGFNVGDILTLKEWNPDTKQYTGRTLIKEVTYILRGSEIISLPEKYSILSIRDPVDK